MSKKQSPDSAQAIPDNKVPAPAKAAKPVAQSSDKATTPASGGKGGLFARLTEFKTYLVLSRAEMRKVSWPTWKETRATSLVVLGFVTVMAILLGLVDLVLSSVVRLILS